MARMMEGTGCGVRVLAAGNEGGTKRTADVVHDERHNHGEGDPRFRPAIPPRITTRHHDRRPLPTAAASLRNPTSLAPATPVPTSPTLPATPASTPRPPPHLPLSVHLRGRTARCPGVFPFHLQVAFPLDRELDAGHGMPDSMPFPRAHVTPIRPHDPLLPTRTRAAHPAHARLLSWFLGAVWGASCLIFPAYLPPLLLYFLSRFAPFRPLLLCAPCFSLLSRSLSAPSSPFRVLIRGRLRRCTRGEDDWDVPGVQYPSPVSGEGSTDAGARRRSRRGRSGNGT
ncbi:hypothetical protein C8R44DRAFT_877175 [Mycena epipterygia]|nr:hypothetical protein C8R44DRAFT_877175 [Mycena epipterygia]